MWQENTGEVKLFKKMNFFWFITLTLGPLGIYIIIIQLSLRTSHI